MSMQEVFQKLDEARDAVKPETFSTMEHRIAGTTAVLARFVGEPLPLMLESLRAINEKLPGYQAEAKVLDEGTAAANRHIGQAALLVGGIPNPTLMEALNATNAAHDKSQDIAGIYKNMQEDVADALGHLEVVTSIVTRLLEESTRTAEQHRSEAQSHWGAATNAMADYEAAAGRSA